MYFFDSVCDYCEEVLGASERDCSNCPYGNPCYGCEHNEKGDCHAQCMTE